MASPFFFVSHSSVKFCRFHVLDDLSAGKAIHWALGLLAWRATTEPIRHAAQRHLIKADGWPVVRDALVGHRRCVLRF